VETHLPTPSLSARVELLIYQKVTMKIGDIMGIYWEYTGGYPNIDIFKRDGIHLHCAQLQCPSKRTKVAAREGPGEFSEKN
jgi:hypothetical protein